MPSGGGSTTQSTRFDPPDWAAAYYPDIVAAGRDLFSQPYQQFEGMTVAPYDPSADNFTLDRAYNGAPDINSARGSMTDTTEGMYLGQGPGAQSSVTPTQNPYFGANPYVDQMIENNAQNMAKSFAQGQQATNDALFARTGGFGSSAHQQLTSQNAANLANSIGNMANNVRMQDYQTQQQLGENNANRYLQADMYNQGQHSQAWDQERRNMLQAAGISGQLAQDDWMAAQQAQGVNQRQTGYQQSLLDSAYQNWQQQQQWPYMQLGGFTGLLGQASGGLGNSFTVKNS